MWATKTDYAKLYGADYFGKQPLAVSFDDRVLPFEVKRICDERSLEAVLDIGSGSGRLVERLRSMGLLTVSCDYEPAHPASLHFDLTLRDEKQSGMLRAQLAASVRGRQHLVTCLDVLEHMDIEDVASAALNLRELTSEWLLASISTRPSSRGNAFHSTVLPLPTWEEVFRIAGFEVVDASLLQAARHLVPDSSDDPNLSLVTHWATADPFRDRRRGEPNYVLMRAMRSPVADAASCIKRILDIAYRDEKRSAFGLGDHPKIAINIHHPQDFINIRPILDVLHRNRVVAYLRRPMLRSDEFDWISGFFRRCGVPTVVFDRTATIDWAGAGCSFLLSNAESTVNISHLSSAQLVEMARYNGSRTLLLQHGIWCEPFNDKTAAFSSDTILAWGSEHYDFLTGTRHTTAGKPGPTGLVSRTEFRSVGAAKFVDSRINPSREILQWRLGVKTEEFRQIILLGTNLKWDAHQTDTAQIRQTLLSVIGQNPDSFFLVKVHPSERATEYREFHAPNVLVLDDILLGCMDLGVPRLLGGVDTIVSSMSTLLLDGAVAGLRCIQYDTKNRFEYRGCSPIKLQELSAAISNLAARSVTDQTFQSIYADAADHDFYGAFRDILNETARSEGDADLALYTAANVALDSWFETEHLREQRQHDHEETINKLHLAEAEAALARAETARAHTLSLQVMADSEGIQQLVYTGGLLRRASFHRSGKPRGWLRWLLLKDRKQGLPRELTRRLLFQKNGGVRPILKSWYLATYAERR